jgi:hypothetical protein
MSHEEETLLDIFSAWYDRNKINIQNIATILSILASIATIIAIWEAYQIFQKQLDIQKEAELNEHISNIASLRTEINQDIELMKSIVTTKQFFIERKVYGSFVNENLKRSIADGKISNFLLKKWLIKLYFSTNDMNGLITDSNNQQSLEKVKLLRGQFLDRISDTYNVTFQNVDEYLKNYENCLNKKKDIRTCSLDENIFPLNCSSTV